MLSVDESVSERFLKAIDRVGRLCYDIVDRAGSYDYTFRVAHATHRALVFSSLWPRVRPVNHPKIADSVCHFELRASVISDHSETGKVAGLLEEGHYFEQAVEVHPSTRRVQVPRSDPIYLNEDDTKNLEEWQGLMDAIIVIHDSVGRIRRRAEKVQNGQGKRRIFGIQKIETKGRPRRTPLIFWKPTSKPGCTRIDAIFSACNQLPPERARAWQWVCNECKKTLGSKPCEEK